MATLLWANSKIQNDTILEGNLCQSKHPEIDEHSGKVTETTCKGINPGVWHLGVLGLLGKKHSSFIINKNNDTEVWNQPVSEYEFSYYNMNSDKKGSLFESAVPILNARDPSAAFRAHGTAYLVGVEMQLSYASETMPDHATTDSEQTDRIEQLNLRYDLELDDRYQVLGGEWHYRAESDPKANRNHSTYPSYPSFMWKFKSENPVAMSEADALIPENTTLPSDKMIEFSSKAASFKFVTYAHDSKGAVMKNPDGKDTVASEELRPQVLGKVLYPLIELAAQSE